MYEILFYEDERGHSPVEEFIKELDKQAMNSKEARILLKQVLHQINILERLGTRAGENFTKYIEDNVWELRPGNRRIFFFMWIDNKIVLLHAFHKKTNKTPRRETEKAKSEMEDWLRRNKNNN